MNDDVRFFAKQELRRYPKIWTVVDAEDIVNDVFLTLLRRVRKHVEGNTWETWDSMSSWEPEDYGRFIRLLIRRRVIELYRKLCGSRRQNIVHTYMESDLPFAEWDPQDDEGRAFGNFGYWDGDGPAWLREWTRFHEKVAKLPAEEKEVLNLLFYQGKNRKQAADTLGVSLSTVKRRWTSARAILAKELNEGLLPKGWDGDEKEPATDT